MSGIDWFAELEATMRSDTTEPRMSSERTETLIADIIAGRIVAPEARAPRRARRRWIATGVAVGVLASGATAAAMLNRSKPERPQEGVACHAAADLTSGSIVIPPATDPLSACTQLWLMGSLPDIDNGGPATDVTPTLFACVGRGGGLDVFPQLSDPPLSCSDLDLVDAVTDVGADPLVLLEERLGNDINAICADVTTARRLAEAALADLGLKEWSVTVRENARDCVKAGQDPEAKTVFLQSIPD